MKHLTEYKIFESSEINQTIKEICYDLNDIGFEVFFDFNKFRGSNFKKIKRNYIIIQKDNCKGFEIDKKFEIIKETIYRIKDYLKSESHEFKNIYVLFTDQNAATINDVDDLEDRIEDYLEDSLNFPNSYSYTAIKKITICYWE
jgi:hypothetical protein